MKNFFKIIIVGMLCFRCEGRGAPVSTAYPDGQRLSGKTATKDRSRLGSPRASSSAKAIRVSIARFGVPFTILAWRIRGANLARGGLYHEEFSCAPHLAEPLSEHARA